MMANARAWELPPTNSLVGFTEEFVRRAAQAYADDVAAMSRAVLGRSNRPFLHARLAPAEQRVRHRLLLTVGDPTGWGRLLESVGPSQEAMRQEARRWARLNVATRQSAVVPPEGTQEV